MVEKTKNHYCAVGKREWCEKKEACSFESAGLWVISEANLLYICLQFASAKVGYDTCKKQVKNKSFL